MNRDNARLKITAYETRDERELKLRSISGELPTARIGESWVYRGLVVEKAPHENRIRDHTTVVVKTPDGRELDQFEFRQHDSATLVDRLDSCRQEWVNGGVPA